MKLPWWLKPAVEPRLLISERGFPLEWALTWSTRNDRVIPKTHTVIAKRWLKCRSSMWGRCWGLTTRDVVAGKVIYTCYVVDGWLAKWVLWHEWAHAWLWQNEGDPDAEHTRVGWTGRIKHK